MAAGLAMLKLQTGALFTLPGTSLERSPTRKPWVSRHSSGVSQRLWMFENTRPTFLIMQCKTVSELCTPKPVLGFWLRLYAHRGAFSR
eukprot:13891349-Alexandrium_andersonii.AAC.1